MNNYLLKPLRAIVWKPKLQLADVLQQLRFDREE